MTVLSAFPTVLKVSGRILIAGDGLKVPKAGKKMPAVKLLKFFSLLLSALSIIIATVSPVFAKVSGSCFNCHTMHNSQNGVLVDPQPFLLNKGGAGGKVYCLGCHAEGLSTNVDPVIGAPQVYSTATIDNAGGNFAYINGAKGSGASSHKGHNVVDLVGADPINTSLPPGTDHGTDPSTFTCAGTWGGCHGKTSTGIRGAHHGHTGNKFTNPTTAATSYRFLTGVAGLENNGQNDITKKWQNADANNHNEYFGATSAYNWQSSCTPCHNNYASPSNNTISGFCGMCHHVFYPLASPWQSHPTDILLPNSGEFSAYTSYSIDAPVARAVVPDNIGNTVTPGSDVVMCLSCHVAHASNYNYMLRWDYSGSGYVAGCKNCHTQK